MRVDVEAALREAAQLGLLNDGDLYAKSGLLEAFSDSGLDAELAESAFIGIRDCVKQGRRLGGLTVEGVGARRGRKYRFVGLSTSGSASGERAVFTPTTVPDREASPPRVSPIGEGAAELDIHYGDNLPILQALPPSSFDPDLHRSSVQYREGAGAYPNTDRARPGRWRPHGLPRQTLPDRKGWDGSFADAFDDFLEFMEPRLKEARRLLKPDGAFFLHIDYREVHYCKILLDQIFGRDSFINEIIWAYGLRRTLQEQVVGEARQHPLVREEPEVVHLRFRGDGPHPLYGPRFGWKGEGCSWQDADRRLVAHHCSDQREREDGLPDAEAAGRLEPPPQGPHRTR